MFPLNGSSTYRSVPAETKLGSISLLRFVHVVHVYSGFPSFEGSRGCQPVGLVSLRVPKIFDSSASALRVD